MPSNLPHRASARPPAWRVRSPARSRPQSQVEKLKAVLDQKQLNAPFSGTIGIPKVDLGQYLTHRHSRRHAAVAADDAGRFHRSGAGVPEPQARAGRQVGFTDDKLAYAGQITGINPKIDPSSRLVSVRGEIDNSSGDLQPGQFVRVRVELPDEKNVIALPQTAVTASLYGDFVFIVHHASKDQKKGGEDAGKAADNSGGGSDAKKKSGEDLVVRQVFVQLGRHNGQRVEVTKGVKAGDVVVTAGENRLSNGMAVTIDNTVNPAKSGNQEAGL